MLFTTLAFGDVASNGGAGGFFSREASGTVLVADGNHNRVARISTSPFAPTTRVTSLDLRTGITASASPGGLVLEAGGTTALALDCNGAGANCTLSGRLVRVDLGSGVVTPIALSLNTPTSIAIESGGATALVTDCGITSGSCTTASRILRIALSNGAQTLIASGFNGLSDVAIEASGTTALVTEAGTNRLLRVVLADGSFTQVASLPSRPLQVVLESGGNSAIVTSGPGRLDRVNLTSGAVTLIAAIPLTHVAVEPGGTTALGMLTQGAGEGPLCALARVNLATGGIDVIASAAFDFPFDLVVDAAGTTAWLTEDRSPNGFLFSMPVPPP